MSFVSCGDEPTPLSACASRPFTMENQVELLRLDLRRFRSPVCVTASAPFSMTVTPVSPFPGDLSTGVFRLTATLSLYRTGTDVVVDAVQVTGSVTGTGTISLTPVLVVAAPPADYTAKLELSYTEFDTQGVLAVTATASAL